MRGETRGWRIEDLIGKEELTVSGIRKDKDGIDHNAAQGTPFAEIPAVGMLLFRELAEGCRGGVGLQDVAGRDDVSESIALGHQAAFFSFAADDEHRSVLLGELAHRSVPADELARGDFDLELAGQVQAAFSLELPTPVGDEDVRPVAA